MKQNLSKYDQPDKIHYNVTIPYVDNTTGLVQASFSETRDIELLHIPRDYYLTIERFSIPASEIPLFIADIQDNQANANLTRYNITIRYLGVDYQQDIIYIAENGVAAPATAVPTQALSPYYYIYSYKHMIEMINTALNAAHTALLVAVPAAPTVIAPYFLYDNVTQMISLVTEFVYATPSAFEIFINEQLLSLLKAFRGVRLGKNLVTGRDFAFRIENSDQTYYAPPDLALPAVPGDPEYLRNWQSYQDLTGMNSFHKIVFTTAGIPISYEQIQVAFTGSTAKFAPILTDFELDVSKPGAQRSILIYFPTGPRRLIDLMSSLPLKKIDFRVEWEDKQGNRYPIFIPYNNVMTLKLLFIRKDSTTQ